MKTTPNHAVCVHTKLNSQPVWIFIWRNIPVVLLYVLNVTIRHLRRVILRDICWHTQVKGPLRVHILPTGLSRTAPWPDTLRFVKMPQSQHYELYFRQHFLFNLGVQLSSQHYTLAWQFELAHSIACSSISPPMLNWPVYILKDLIYFFKLSSLCNDPSTALQVAARTLGCNSLVWTRFFLNNSKVWYSPGTTSNQF